MFVVDLKVFVFVCCVVVVGWDVWLLSGYYCVFVYLLFEYDELVES